MAVARCDRANTIKNHAAVAVEKAGIEPATVGTNLEAIVAWNADGDRPTTDVAKLSAGLVDIVEKLADSIVTAGQDTGQTKAVDPETSGATPTEATEGFITGVQGGQQSKSREWTLVNRSPSKKNSPGPKSQILAAKKIDMSNSFDVLVNEQNHTMKDDGKDVQQMNDEAGQLLESSSKSRRILGRKGSRLIVIKVTTSPVQN